MGSQIKEADIIVYADDDLKSPLIIVECKKPDVSELEFARAVDQAFQVKNLDQLGIPQKRCFFFPMQEVYFEYCSSEEAYQRL